MEEVGLMPNGYMLFREKNKAGGHTYYSDEIGGGVVVWDTCLVYKTSLEAAIKAEDEYNERTK